MTTRKVNFTIDGDVVASLKERVAKRSRSRFVSVAIREKLNQLEQEQLRQTLIEGYMDRRAEDAELSREWDGPTLDGWR